MIFCNVTKISDKKGKAIFIEKIRLVIQIVQAYADMLGEKLSDHKYSVDKALIELKEMNIVENELQLTELKSVAKTHYEMLLKALSFYHECKEETDYCLSIFSVEYRKMQRAKNNRLELPTYADFFAGAGGLSLGFTQAGFRVELVNEIEPLAVETYRLNHPEVDPLKIVNGDIKEVINNLHDYVGDKQIDVVIGGPPCQSFSSANQQRIIDDPRNELYKYFIQAVEKIKPKFVLMENVKGMKKVANQVVEDFHNVKVEVDGMECSYEVDFHVFNSEDFSVAQRRERLIYIAVRSDVINNKNITPQGLIDEVLGSTMFNNRYVLRDALEYLKELEANKIKGKNEEDCHLSGKKVDVNDYMENTNDYLQMINGGKKNRLVYNHKARFLNETNYEVYRLLDQGDDATNEKVAHVMPYSHRNHVFKDKYFKLIESNPSRTITAHLTMDGHSHIHPTQVRSLTPREAARIQSFPDHYIFLGPYLKTFTQIGNAVPPLMAKSFAEMIKKYI